jgi:hypothetical protein
VLIRAQLIVIAILALLGTSSLLATPANKRALERHFGNLLPKNLNSCATCHVHAEAHGAETLKEFPHNLFGARLRALSHKTRINDRLSTVTDEDSDADGSSDLIEILAGTAPGDAKQKPHLTSAALATLSARYEKLRNQYEWAPFKPVSRPDVPTVKTTELRNPIDNFIATQHEQRGLKPQEPANKDTLLRRLHLDLIGLNPTRAERETFLKNTSPEAYEDVVNALLKRPEYGERWGRHWMDIWRYSDWAGYKAAIRDSQRHIWHWRDWIVEALNEDKPYDRMILEMLAGDELAPEDSNTLRATGYLARHYFANRQQWMDNVVKHTSQAFLGITVGCAKCHDHMYDPIPQTDYYAMRAVFESYNVRTDRVPGELDIMKGGIPRVYDQSLTSKTYLYERGDERRPVKDKAIAPNTPVSLGGSYLAKPVPLPRLAYQPDRRAFVVADLLAAAERKLKAATNEPARASATLNLAALKTELSVEQIEGNGKQDSAEWKQAAQQTTQLQREAAVAAEIAAIDSSKRAQTQAAADQKTAKSAAAKSRAARALSTATKNIAAAKKKLLAAEKVLKGKPTTKFKRRSPKTYLSSSSGRRLAFARWLSDKGNPLTARVAMNHIWLRHFGQPIVPTVAEFGGNGREPSHPALLDWLAAEFMARDWSMKDMHRLIVTSAAYRRSGVTDPDNEKIDPDNRFLWRMPSRRMEGEIVRDNLLHIGGTLDRTFGGPDIDNKTAQSSKRRSIYLRHAHEKLVEFVQIFDGPKVSECYMRDESVQPHQALAMANSRLTFDQSKELTAQLAKESNTPNAFVHAAYEAILSRAPKPDEIRLCQQFLKQHASDGQERLVMVLFNHNDFVTIR